MWLDVVCDRCSHLSSTSRTVAANAADALRALPLHGRAIKMMPTTLSLRHGGSPNLATDRAPFGSEAKRYHDESHVNAHGYGATREAAMAAFAKSWRREQTP